MDERTARGVRIRNTPPAQETTETAASLWRMWVQEIVKDPMMDKTRTIAHVRAHILKHMPDQADSKGRWEEWLAGAYNLLAILGHMYETDPPHTLGVDLLYRKWLHAPFDHTPPPVQSETPPVQSETPCPAKKLATKKRTTKKVERRARGSGS